MRFTFDATTVDPNQMQQPVPLDWYHVAITREEVKETNGQAGKGYQLTFWLKVLSGPHAGREQRDGMNIDNPNPTTVRIAQQRLSAYAHVTGQVRFNDTAELFNKPFYARMGPQADDPKYGEVLALKDMQGNEPGRQTSTNQAAQNSAWEQQAKMQASAGQTGIQTGMFAQNAPATSPFSPSFANGGLTAAFPASQPPQQSGFSQPATRLPVADADAGWPPWMK